MHVTCCARFLLLIGLLALTPFAASGQTIELWPGGAPGESGDIGAETSETRPGDTTIRVGNVTKPTLTVFPAPADKATGTAVVICPGGGYNILAWNKEGTEIAEWLNSIGVTGVVLKYRVPAKQGTPREAAPLSDVQRAMGLVRQHAAEWKIDPKRVGVLGFSAGGHLSASLGANHERRSYEPVDAADALSCRPDFTLLIYPAYLVGGRGAPKTARELAPEVKVTANTPPTFLVQTEDDSVRVQSSLYYYLALAEAKVPAEMHLYARGGHGYGLRPSEFAVSHWPDLAAGWLRSLGLLTPAAAR